MTLQTDSAGRFRRIGLVSTVLQDAPMSLTSHLKDPRSPISRFLAEHLPDTKAVLDDYRTRLLRLNSWSRRG
jgi:hypothetical protein